MFDVEVAAIDPERACQRQRTPGSSSTGDPLNCETPLPALTGGSVVPNARFYVRNHFQIPDLDQATWRLLVGGLVDRPLCLSLPQLRAMPLAATTVTLECAGNGRSHIEPPVPGEQWDLGAVSTAEWAGVPLVEVLERAGVQTGRARSCSRCRPRRRRRPSTAGVFRAQPFPRRVGLARPCWPTR
jgi:DMSO/TMAO reductase YedYZ molybdopterin-dependent catalytic subunit